MMKLVELAIVAAVADPDGNITINAYCRDCGAKLVERTARIEVLTADKALRAEWEREDAAAVVAHYDEAGRGADHGRN